MRTSKPAWSPSAALSGWTELIFSSEEGGCPEGGDLFQETGSVPKVTSPEILAPPDPNLPPVWCHNCPGRKKTQVGKGPRGGRSLKEEQEEMA